MKFERDQSTFLPQAHPANMNNVRRNSEDLGLVEIKGGTGKPLCPHLGNYALRSLDKFHAEYDASTYVPIDEIASLQVDSRQELIIRAQQLFSLHAVHRVEDRETMRHASLAGCGVTVAYIEMIARMQAQEENEFDSENFQRLAKKSLPTLMTIAATSRQADGILTENIMNWDRRQVASMSDVAIYTGLELDESYFELQRDSGVRLRNDEFTRKRIRTRTGSGFDFSPNKNDILFGCPFRSRIPLFYTAVTEAMVANDLVQSFYINDPQA